MNTDKNRKGERGKPTRVRFLTLFHFLSSIFLFCASAHPADAQSAPARPDTRERVDLLITGGMVVTMDAERRIIADGAVAVRGDSIVAVGPRAEIAKKYRSARVLNARGKLVLPGLINGHGHVPMTLFRGLADDLTLQEWLEKYIFPAEARNVKPDFVEWGTRLALVEMIRSGTTTYADMYYFEDVIARVTKQAGMRGVLGETILQFPSPDSKTTADAMRYTEEFLKRWQGDPLIHAAVAPHAVYTNTAENLRESAALARRYNAPILIHVSETKKEVDDAQAQWGMTPVAYLEKLGILGPDVLAAHCVWFTADDIAIAKRREVGCVHNPSSNIKLGSGFAPVKDMIAADMRLGLGTDGAAGNNDLNMFEEIDLAAKLAKVKDRDPAAVNAERALAMATINGARALHMEKEIGSIEAGKKADIIFVRTDAPHAVPSYDVYSQIVYALKASDVDTVLVGGRVLMQGRRLLTLDEPLILTKAREYAAKVKASLK